MAKFKRQVPLFCDRPSYKSIGYARQSHQEKTSITGQIDELTNAGCILIFQESTSSSNKEKHQFEAALKTLEKGDEIVFTKLDRAFKSQKHCINTLCHLQEKGIHVRTTDGIINTRALGNLGPYILGLLHGIGEIERQIAIERSKESIKKRKEEGGSLGGRPKVNNEKEVLVIRLRHEGCSYRSIRKQTGLALSTIRRIIVEHETIKSSRYDIPS